MSDLLVKRDARISDCGLYRYWLSRVWDDSVEKAVFVMLNPSTADAEQDDATIRKCMGFARRWGNGGIIVVNLFAFRATKPKDMMRARDPVGPDNARWIAEVCDNRQVRCAWGANGGHRNRDLEVLPLLLRSGEGVTALKLTKHGQPQHPLYVAYDTQPIDYPPQSFAALKAGETT